MHCSDRNSMQSHMTFGTMLSKPAMLTGVGPKDILIYIELLVCMEKTACTRLFIAACRELIKEQKQPGFI